MSNEKLIAEARAWNEEHLRDYNYTSCTPFCPSEEHEHGLVGAERLIDRLAEALEAATVEPEWEYQWGAPGETLDGLDPYATYEEARSIMRKESDYESHRVMRRRKAGTWEPVGGESNGDRS